MAYRSILYEQREGIGVITLNRPEKRNALSLELLREFASCMEEVGSGRSAKVVIVKGAGEHFCAGHDLNEILKGELSDVRRLFEVCLDLMMILQEAPQPVIAQVRGVATAAGCQLVAACDLAVAEEGARFATPGVQIGLFCSTPMVPLYRAVGRKKALEMLFTGDFVGAGQAREWGLVNRVVPLDALEQETLGLAEQIARYSSLTLGIGKRAFYRQVNMADRDAYEYAKEVISANAVMDDAIEGISAFLEKRSPVWKDA
ncbi:MAG: enoyl-CoA hydratase [Deltaproteobacteria bacterium]|nr:enoyl-CoA hydratase [Deltaproteobacteria bacterium]